MRGGSANLMQGERRRPLLDCPGLFLISLHPTSKPENVCLRLCMVCGFVESVSRTKAGLCLHYLAENKTPAN